ETPMRARTWRSPALAFPRFVSRLCQSCIHVSDSTRDNIHSHTNTPAHTHTWCRPNTCMESMSMSCLQSEGVGGGVLTDGGTVYEKRAEKHSASISAVSGASFVLIGP